MNYIKETVEILKNIDNLKISVKNLTLRYKENKEALTSVKALNMSGMPNAQGGNIPDDRICNLIFEQQELLKNIKNTKKKLRKLDTLLAALTDEEKEILFKAYGKEYEYMTDSDIAKELNMCRRTYLDKKKKVTKKLAIQIWGLASI